MILFSNFIPILVGSKKSVFMTNVTNFASKMKKVFSFLFGKRIEDENDHDLKVPAAAKKEKDRHYWIFEFKFIKIDRKSQDYVYSSEKWDGWIREVFRGRASFRVAVFCGGEGSIWRVKSGRDDVV